MIAAGDANASAAGRPQETLSLAGEGQQQHQAGDAAACAAAEQHAETAQTAGVAHARREPHEQPSAAEPDPGPLLGAQGEGPGTSGAAAAAAAAGEDPPGLGAAASSGAALVVAGDLDASEVVLRVQVCKPKGDPRRSQARRSNSHTGWSASAQSVRSFLLLDDELLSSRSPCRSAPLSAHRSSSCSGASC